MSYLKTNEKIGNIDETITKKDQMTVTELKNIIANMKTHRAETKKWHIFQMLE